MHHLPTLDSAKNDLQVGIGYNTTGDMPYIFFRTTFDAAKVAINAATIKQKKLAFNAWSVEAKLPLSALGINGEVDTSFGFNISHEDNNVYSYNHWAANGTFTFWNDTSGYGKVTHKKSSVEATKQIYDFRVVHPWWQRTDGTGIGDDVDLTTEATDYAKVAEAAELFKKSDRGGRTNDIANTAPWYYGGKSNNAIYLCNNAFQGMRISPVGNWGSVIIDVAADGNYNLSTELRIGIILGLLDVYLPPKNEVDG